MARGSYQRRKRAWLPGAISAHMQKRSREQDCACKMPQQLLRRSIELASHISVKLPPHARCRSCSPGAHRQIACALYGIAEKHSRLQ